MPVKSISAEDSLLTISDAARESNCPYNTIKRAILLGKLIPFQNNPTTLILKSELEKFRGGRDNESSN